MSKITPKANTQKKLRLLNAISGKELSLKVVE